MVAYRTTRKGTDQDGAAPEGGGGPATGDSVGGAERSAPVVHGWRAARGSVAPLQSRVSLANTLSCSRLRLANLL